MNRTTTTTTPLPTGNKHIRRTLRKKILSITPRGKLTAEFGELFETITVQNGQHNKSLNAKQYGTHSYHPAVKDMQGVKATSYIRARNNKFQKRQFIRHNFSLPPFFSIIILD
jgi:hypothetical protein